MKKLFALLALGAIGSAIVYLSSCNNSTNDPKQTEGASTKDSIDKVLAKGEYLARHVAGCIDCHSKRDLTKYSAPVIAGTEGGGGFEFIPAYGIPGTLYSKNITPDPETGIGTWTDDEILRAITQGISKAGDTLFPLMPYANYNRMAKEDLLAIIAYVRTLKPIKNNIQARQLMVPIAIVYPGKFLQPSIEGNLRPPTTDKANYGQYLTTFASCGDCHHPLTPQGPDMSKPFAGGHVFDAGSFKVASANITPDSTTGIGAWSEERFLNKFTIYREEKNYNFEPGRQNTIMSLSEYAGMRDEDIKAIYAYLQTVKPANNKVDKYPK